MARVPGLPRPRRGYILHNKQMFGPGKVACEGNLVRASVVPKIGPLFT